MMRNLLVAIALLLAPLLTHADSGFTSRPLFDQSNVAITGGTISGVTLTGDVSGTAANVTGTVAADHGGTGVANNAAATLTRSGAHALTFTTSGTTGLTLPTTGTLAILGANTFSGLQTFNAGIAIPTGFNLTGAGTAALSGFKSGSFGTAGNAGTLALLGTTSGTATFSVDATTTTVTLDKAFAIADNFSVATTRFTVNAATGALTINSGAATSSVLNLVDVDKGTFQFQVGVNSGGTGVGDYILYSAPTSRGHSWAVNNVSVLSALAAGVTIPGILTISAIPSASGVRFLCISTTGVVTSQAAACVGT